MTATGNGVTLDGISFSISNQSALLATARAQAMQAANTEATQVAAGGGLALGPIVSITDQENAGQYVYYNVNAAVPVATGTRCAGATGSAADLGPGDGRLPARCLLLSTLLHRSRAIRADCPDARVASRQSALRSPGVAPGRRGDLPGAVVA